MKCIKCGRSRDLRLGWCYQCFEKAQKIRARKNKKRKTKK
jgi:NMD protein affecting ribosome stability and mRNA decay